MPYDITEARRQQYRRSSIDSAKAKHRALKGSGPPPVHPIYTPRLDPHDLMPALPCNGLQALSLFSGGGGLDLGFERAGYGHIASYDVLEICAETLLLNRPHWTVRGGAAGDVTGVDWSPFVGQVDVLHGGPPCQPFSLAGYRMGHDDERNMWPEFVRAVQSIRPRVFVAENVAGLLTSQFARYIRNAIVRPLGEYTILTLRLHAAMFGVPQSRERVIFVGFLHADDASHFVQPAATHRYGHLIPKNGTSQDAQGALFVAEPELPRCMGVREALGLPDIGIDALAPTLRSGFTGPRYSTSVLNSVASQKLWAMLQIWPNGIAPSREQASLFVARDGHFRMSIQDCALIQGFPESWKVAGSVYKALGQIGNAVAPPMGYRVAVSVTRALCRHAESI